MFDSVDVDENGNDKLFDDMKQSNTIDVKSKELAPNRKAKKKKEPQVTHNSFYFPENK